MEQLPPDHFLEGTTTFCNKQMQQNFQILSYLSLVLRHQRGTSIGFTAKRQSAPPIL